MYNKSSFFYSNLPECDISMNLSSLVSQKFTIVYKKNARSILLVKKMISFRNRPQVIVVTLHYRLSFSATLNIR